MWMRENNQGTVDNQSQGSSPSVAQNPAVDVGAETNPHVRISYKSLSDLLTTLDLKPEKWLQPAALPKPENIFHTVSMEAKQVPSFTEAGVGLRVNPDGYSEQAEFYIQDWLFATYRGGAEGEKRTLFDSIVQAVGEEKLLATLDYEPRGPSASEEKQRSLDALALHIAYSNPYFADFENQEMKPEDAVTEALSAIQDKYLRNARVTHYELSDTPPDGYEFLPSDTATHPHTSVAAENEWAERDKVSTRRLAAEIGILHQPAFIDARDFNRPPPTKSYTNVDLTAFSSTNEILIPVQGENKIFVLENLWQGCAVFHVEGKVFVASLDQSVSKFIAARNLHQPQDTLSSEQFQGLLKDISDAPTFCTRTLTPKNKTATDKSRAWSLNGDGLVDLISHHNGTLYLKSARTAGGQSILKITRDDSHGGLVLESNSSEVHDTYHKRVMSLQNLHNLDSPRVVKKSAVELLQPRKMLTTLAASMKAPILEEEIPMAPCNGGRAEARLIYQADAEGKLERTGAYCKFSQSTVAANVNLGGSGMSVEDAIHYILIEQEVPAQKLVAMARETLERLTRDVDAFAERFREYRGNDLNEFAVDVAFVWNKEQEQVDFYLIEVQRGFAFEGLKQVDPEAAVNVEARRMALMTDEQRLQHLMRSLWS